MFALMIILMDQHQLRYGAVKKVTQIKHNGLKLGTDCWAVTIYLHDQTLLSDPQLFGLWTYHSNVITPISKNHSTTDDFLLVFAVFSLKYN